MGTIPLRFGAGQGSGLIFGENLSFSLGEYVEVFADSCLLGGLPEPLQRLVHRFFGERKGSVVHRDEALRAEVEEGQHGVFGAHVYATEAIGLIGADGKQGDLRRETRADFVEAGEVAGVSGVIDALGAVLQVVSTETAVGVAEDAGAPVLRGCRDDFDTADVCGLPPVERADFRKAQLLYEVLNVFRHDDEGRLAGEFAGVADDFAQRWEVEMVHVGVREEHSVDGRKVLDAHAGAAHAMDEDEPVREDGIDEEVEAADLKQEGRVADEGDAELIRRGDDRLVLFSGRRMKRGFRNEF